MKIIVTKIDQKQNINYVLFECAHGSGEGVWRDEKAEIGATTHVEFDIEKLHAIGKCLTADRSYVIEAKDNITRLAGDIIEIQDEIVCFRFAETVIQLDRIVENLAVGDWVIVAVEA